VGAAVGTALGWLAGASTGYTYSNPYYVEPSVEVPAALSYAEPIVIQIPAEEPAPPPDVNITLSQETTATPSLTPAPPAEEPKEPPKEEPKEDPAVKEAVARMDEARAAFAKGEYAKAQELIEKGIQKLPGDATLHEFRGLTQFAQKKYKDAAATIYAVLAAGPGWNWDTLKSNYDSEKTYQEQLRALEEHSRANPKAAEDHFLLAYHYLVLDSKDAAVKQLEEVVKLIPKDELSALLLKALKEPPPTDRPEPKP
jgi:tetratricopeptide (TPR) repeat protein